MRITLLVFILGFSLKVVAQSAYVPIGDYYNHMIDRYEIKGKNFNSNLHTSFKPVSRASVASLIDTLRYDLTKVDEENIEYLKTDNWEFFDGAAESDKRLMKKFYSRKPDFISVDNPDFQLHASPVLYLGAGRDTNSGSMPIINTRGFEIRGQIDDKLIFYTYLTENQAVFPNYVQNRILDDGVIPNQGFWKRFGTNGVDYFDARGYIQLNATKHISLQLGHDKNFIGNGYRSLLLSDFSSSYPFLKIQTKVWKLQYTNLFAELIADIDGNSGGTFGVGVFPKKFMTLHHLSINLTKNFNLGVFESIIFHRGDSTGNAFELNYLNPIIFYTAVEQQSGSPDNALFGIDFKWNVKGGISLYGQAMLDELIVGELKAGNGWWGNKFAWQLGGKYIDAFNISQLDLQVEYNFARPFTYTHESIFTSYAHYRQPLAHPLGNNFKETILIGRYQPIQKLTLEGKLILAKSGTENPNGTNLGTNVLRSYNDRASDYGHTTGQGIATELKLVHISASYMFKHNLFIDLSHTYRNLSSADAALNQTTQYTAIALRLNIGKKNFSF